MTMPLSIEQVAGSIKALEEQYQTIAHNLANSSTPGYKRRLTTFSQALAQQLAHVGKPIAGGAVTAATVTDFSAAHPVQTGRTLDLFLQGGGFFMIETDQGPLYSRNGCFRTNAQGQLVTTAGQLVAGQNGPIVVPPTAGVEDIRVSADGTVRADRTAIGKLRLVSFPPEVSLESVGNGCFRASSTATPEDDLQTKVLQGAYEASNVSAIEELVALMAVTRLYEANMKTIQAQDQKNQTLLQAAS